MVIFRLDIRLDITIYRGRAYYYTPHDTEHSIKWNNVFSAYNSMRQSLLTSVC